MPLFDKLTRNILASNPRVTKLKINWDDQSTSNGNGVASHEGNGDSMSTQENDENGQPMPPPPPNNPYLPENMRRPNPLPLQKDPNLESPMKSGLRHKEDSNSCSQDMDFD